MPGYTEAKRITDRKRWLKRFEEVKAFLEKHHRLPKKEEQPLYHWLINQRKTKTRLDIQQKSLLRTVGFPLKQQKPSFEACIKRYKKDPTLRASKDWERRMVRRYRKGTLSKKQIAKLRKVIDLEREIKPMDPQGMNHRRHRESLEQVIPLWKQYANKDTRPFLTYRERQKANLWRQNLKRRYCAGKLPPEEITLLKELKVI